MVGLVNRHQLAAVLLAAFSFADSAVPQPALGQSVGVYGLTQSGWRIVRQVEKQEIRAGVLPYAGLARVISITEYHLEKQGQMMVCRLSYDSQKDTQEEKCEEPQT
tara:strand:- start:1485 stop:1802 length:318 start_codon:yes stop_codon:yes gene_type:complete